MAAPLLAGMGALPLALQTALVGLLIQLQGGADVKLEELTVRALPYHQLWLLL